MKKGMVFILPLVFCWIFTIQTNAEMKITPGGVTTPDSSASLHLIGNFSGGILQNPPGAVISGRNTYTGSDASFGGYFTAAGTYGEGVFAIATGINGKAISGWASNSGDTTNYGGYFASSGYNGMGVYGSASGSTGTGVKGEATASTNDYNYGGYFSAAGGHGRGVYGQASGSSGEGVRGMATNTGNTTNYGGYFQANGSNGRGVYCLASGSTGTAVEGVATNITNVTNYGGYFSAGGVKGIGVYGEASYAVHVLGNPNNYGGYFTAAGYDGRGVYGKATGGYGIGVYGEATGSNGVAVRGDGDDYDFYAGGSGNYYPFTGAHEVKLSADMPEEDLTGMIVSATGQTEYKTNEKGNIDISTTLPTVTLSSKVGDKAVFGVMVKQGPLPKDHWYKSEEGDRFGGVNAVGEGRVWVTDINGPIETGDYITTSEIPGYGQMQNDDLLHSYTLGKAIQTVDWDKITDAIQHNGQTYKRYLLAVVYTSG